MIIRSKICRHNLTYNFLSKISLLKPPTVSLEQRYFLPIHENYGANDLLAARINKF